MSKSIYVGNIPFRVTESELQDVFAQYGEVESVKFIKDRESGRFRGFGFVEMNDGEAEKAIEALNDFEYSGRVLRVNEAHQSAQAVSRN